MMLRTIRMKTMGGLVALPALLAGCAAKPPSKIETKVAYWAKHHVTIGGKKDANPIKASEESIDEGKQSFTSYCMVCHGLDGQNTGVPFAATISPPVPSLASAEVQSYTDGQLKWIIKNGIYPSGMPPSNGDFSEKEMWQMVVYIRHLPKAGSLGDPAVYGGLYQVESSIANIDASAMDLWPAPCNRTVRLAPLIEGGVSCRYRPENHTGNPSQFHRTGHAVIGLPCLNEEPKHA